MSNRARSARRRDGDVFQIPLAEGNYAYCQLGQNPLVGFYDRLFQRAVSLDALADSGFGFIIWVYRTALREGRWRYVGSAPLGFETPTFLHQDALTGALSYYRDGKIIGPLMHVSDVERLEPAAVWDREHVEQRLLDHFAGRPNAQLVAIRSRMRHALAQ